MKNLKSSLIASYPSAITVYCLVLLFLAMAASPGCRPSGRMHPDDAPVSVRNDAWLLTGFGGGGAMFWPAISPHDPDYAFVACDMTGSYVT